MERFIQLFVNFLALVYHCFDRIVIHGYLSGLSRPEQVVYFFRQVLGIPVVSKEILSQRTSKTGPPITTAVSSPSVNSSCFPPTPAMPGCSTPPTTLRSVWPKTVTPNRFIWRKPIPA